MEAAPPVKATAPPAPLPGRPAPHPPARLRRGVAAVRPSAAAKLGVALGGGHALIGHGIIGRLTEDVDLFTDDEHGVEAAADAVETALRDAGLEPDRQDRAAGLSDIFP